MASKEEIKLGILKAVLKGKISGLKKGLEETSDDIKPLMEMRIGFAIQELEEVLSFLLEDEDKKN